MPESLYQQIIALLRYIASPAIGFAVVVLVDDSHGAAKAVSNAFKLYGSPPSIWQIGGVLAILGVTVYFSHRTLIHPLITNRILARYKRTMKPLPTRDELDFARWERRGREEHSPGRSAQAVLDESNASAHFFYCSAWSSLLLALLLRVWDPTNYRPSHWSWASLAVVVLAFVSIALIADFRTARLDICAYRRYNCGDERHEIPVDDGKQRSTAGGDEAP